MKSPLPAGYEFCIMENNRHPSTISRTHSGEIRYAVTDVNFTGQAMQTRIRCLTQRRKAAKKRQKMRIMGGMRMGKGSRRLFLRPMSNTSQDKYGSFTLRGLAPLREDEDE